MHFDLKFAAATFLGGAAATDITVLGSDHRVDWHKSFPTVGMACPHLQNRRASRMWGGGGQILGQGGLDLGITSADWVKMKHCQT
jgi:hypothetical protein